MKQMIESECTCCGTKLDACIHPDEATGTIFNTPKTPSEGDFTICIECANVMRYNEDFTLRALDQDDMDHIYRNKELFSEINHMIDQVRTNNSK